MKKLPDVRHYMKDANIDILDKVSLESVISRLAPEEREILELWIWHGMNFEEIGEIIGKKYRGRILTGSAIRYHKNRIMRRLKDWMGEV